MKQEYSLAFELFLEKHLEHLPMILDLKGHNERYTETQVKLPQFYLRGKQRKLNLQELLPKELLKLSGIYGSFLDSISFAFMEIK